MCESDGVEMYFTTPSGARYKLNWPPLGQEGDFDQHFSPGKGDVDSMPQSPGVYAEIHRPTNYIRIGSSSKMRTRNKRHINWAKRHKDGTHTKPSEINRKGDIVEIAKSNGAEGLEYYVVCPIRECDVHGMDCKAEREAVENFLHDLCRRQTRYLNMNAEAKHKRRW